MVGSIVDPYHCEWGRVVGDRIRRLRRDRGLTLIQLGADVRGPDGRGYTGGFISRLERGRAAASLTSTP
jgi:hypothetical protein